MAGPARPQFVLFGSSIVQYSFRDGGWGAALADLYARQADLVLRGYSGWNSRQALNVYKEVFPKDAPVKPALAIVYFGGNDSVRPHPSGLGQHVPLPQFVENMKKIGVHIKSLSEKSRVIFLSSPPVNEKQILESYGNDMGRSNESCRVYAEACIKLCQEIGIAGIDLWTAFQRKEDWLTTCFTDGFHLSEGGSKIVVNEILKVIKYANWEPSLNYVSLPLEYDEDSPYYPVGPDGKTMNSAKSWLEYTSQVQENL